MNEAEQWKGLDRNEEPWLTLNSIWRELCEYREKLLDARADYEDIGIHLGYLDGKLEASGFVQNLIFTELLETIRKKRNDNTD